MTIASRADFKEYCLRKLGKPVIEINVADEQVEDRIDEAVQKWQEYHFDGSERTYVRHQITQDDIDNTCICLLYTSPSPRDKRQSRMPSSA